VDAVGNIGTATATVTIPDQAAPVVTSPLSITVAAVDATGTPATDVAITAFLAGTTVLDNVDGPITLFTHDGPAQYPLGATVVTVTATDASGNVGSAPFTITVVDTTAPTITLVGAATANLRAGSAYVDAGFNATDLVGGDLSADVITGGTVDGNTPGVYVLTFDVQDGAGNGATRVTRTVNVLQGTRLVSTGIAGAVADGGSRDAGLSVDGRFVVFAANASNLVSGAGGGLFQVYRRDLQTGVTLRISETAAGVAGDGDSLRPTVSADGRFVAYESASTNLVVGDIQGFIDVLLHDTQTGITRRISQTGAGVAGWQASAARTGFTALTGPPPGPRKPPRRRFRDRRRTWRG